MVNNIKKKVLLVASHVFDEKLKFKAKCGGKKTKRNLKFGVKNIIKNIKKKNALMGENGV